MGRGRTNKEIAEELVLGVRTVGMHVSHVLVNPSRARVVHVAEKNLIVVRNGMPDVSVNGRNGLRNVSAG